MLYYRTLSQPWSTNTTTATFTVTIMSFPLSCSTNNRKTDERDSQSRTPLTVPAEDAPTEPSANGVAIETAAMATSGVSEAADLTESAKMGGPAAAVVEEEEPAGGSDVVIAEGSQRSHESPKKGVEGVAEAKGGHTATLEAPPVPEVREKIVERVVVEEKVCVGRRGIVTHTALQKRLTHHTYPPYMIFSRGGGGRLISVPSPRKSGIL